MITEMDPNRFVTHSLTDARILRILSAALEAVDPAAAVRNYLPQVSGKVYGLGIGKAAIPMLTALAETTQLSGALAISKHASGLSRNLFPVILGSHPIPDSRSQLAGEGALEFVSALTADDTLICLISGGGSALVTAPYAGISLQDMQTLTALLLSCGARIDEINTLRRQLDRIKGGGLVRATKARVISLILSDVVGSPLETIASGPTVQDPTTRADAIAILMKYQIEKKIPNTIIHLLESGSLLPDREQLAVRLQSKNIIIGDNKLAALAALEQAVQSLPVVNESRVAEIRLALEEGRYQVNPERIADKLLRTEQELSTK